MGERRSERSGREMGGQIGNNPKGPDISGIAFLLAHFHKWEKLAGREEEDEIVLFVLLTTITIFFGYLAELMVGRGKLCDKLINAPLIRACSALFLWLEKGLGCVKNMEANFHRSKSMGQISPQLWG
jgi:hypothetical protein